MSKNIFSYLAVFLFSLIGTGPLFAQQKIDSLKRLVRTDKEDTNKVIHLNALAWQLKNNNPDTAILLTEKALVIARNSGWKKGIAKSLNNLGAYYWLKGNYPKALENYLSALKIQEEIGDKNGVAQCLGNIGLVYWSKADHQKALDYYFKALKIDEELGRKKGIAADLVNIGLVYQDQKNYKKALDHYLQALKLLENSEFKDEFAATLGDIGIVYHDLGDYSKALTYYLRALKLAKEIGDKNSVAINLGSIGSLYISEKKYQEAEMYLLDALKLHKELGTLNYERQYEELLSVLYRKTNRFELALDHYQRAMALKDTLFNREKNEEITRKEMTFEFEKRVAVANAEQEKQQVLAAAESRRQKLFMWLFASVGIGVAIIALIIARALRITRRQKNIIEEQKTLVDVKQKAMLDSIHYARRIQTSLMTTEKQVHKILARMKKEI